MKTNKREGRFDPRLIGKSIQRDVERMLVLGQGMADEAQQLALTYSDDYIGSRAKQSIRASLDNLDDAEQYLMKVARGMTSSSPSVVTNRHADVVYYLNRYQAAVEALRRWSTNGGRGYGELRQIADKIEKKVYLLNAAVPARAGAQSSTEAAQLGREIAAVLHLNSRLQKNQLMFGSVITRLLQLLQSLRKAVTELKQDNISTMADLAVNDVRKQLIGVTLELEEVLRRIGKEPFAAGTSSFAEGKHVLAKLYQMRERLSRLAASL